MRWPWEKRRETKSAVLGLTDELGKFLIFGETGAETPSSALNLYEKSTAVSVPINKIADPFSVIKPVLVLDGTKMVYKHPVLDRIKNPSPDYTMELFLEVMAKNFLITGEAVVVGLGNVDRPPLELQPLSPSVLSPVEGPGGLTERHIVAGNTLPGNYVRAVDKGRVRYLNGGFRELCQIRNFSTRGNALLRGQSLLVAAAKEARSHILGTQHNISLLEKGGRVSLVFHFDEDMDEDEFEAVKARVIEQYGGAPVAGQIGVTAGGKLTIKEMGISNRDMDWPSLMKIAQKSVALQYNVPLPLITDERQTMNNYKEGKVALFDDAVIPLSRRVLGALSDFLLPKYRLDPTKATIALNPDEVTALVERRNDELLKRKKISVESTNELRAILGREPTDGGDKVLVPANMIPVGTDLFTTDNAPDVREAPSEAG